MKTKGFDRFDQRMSELARKLPAVAGKGIEKALDQTKEAAVRFAPGRVRGTIRAEVIDRKGNRIAGRVFNDTSKEFWSSYVEFGTGFKVDDQGNPEAIRLKRAKRIPWYIHVSMVPPSFARYGYPIVTGANGEQYYEVDGMQPHPYMKPAAFMSREKNAQAVADEIATLFREVFG